MANNKHWTMVTKSIKGAISSSISSPPLNKVICARPLANNDLNWVTKSRLRSCCVPCQTPLKRRCPILSLLSLVFLYGLSLSSFLCLTASLSRSFHLSISLSASQPLYLVLLIFLSLSLHLYLSISFFSSFSLDLSLLPLSLYLSLSLHFLLCISAKSLDRVFIKDTLISLL